MSSYLDILTDYCVKHPVHTYLEIGIGHGDSLKALTNSAHRPEHILAVDPDLSNMDPSLKDKAECFASTSDQFFTMAESMQFDMCFIDGLHLFEQVLKDFINCEKHSTKDSMIFIHDVLPRGPWTAGRELASVSYSQLTRAWNGDVWKIVPILKEFRPDLKLTVHNVTDGLLQVSDLDPSSTALSDEYDRIVHKYMNLPYNAYHRFHRTSDTLIFCTCAQTDAEKYVQKVHDWYSMLKEHFPDADYYCGVDGTIPADMKKLVRMHFEEFTPVLGRSSMRVFPGWRRSYGKLLDRALQCDYPYVFHVENDVRINNWNKVKEYINKPGLYSSWCPNWNFIEAAFQVLNDKAAVKALRDRYVTDAGINEGCLFEKYLQTYPFKYVFSSVRLHDKNCPENTNVDFTAQSC